MKLYLIGLLGSGKSVLGKELSQLLKLPFIDLDDELEAQVGLKVSKIFSTLNARCLRPTASGCEGLAAGFGKEKSSMI